MTNSEQRRLTNWRLKVLQAATNAGNVARTCRHFGLSRKTFYKWHQRYHQHGEIGLADRARAPHHSPRATPPEVVGKSCIWPALPLRPGQDCRLSEAVSRPLNRHRDGASHSGQARHESAAGQLKIPAPRLPLDAL